MLILNKNINAKRNYVITGNYDFNVSEKLLNYLRLLIITLKILNIYFQAYKMDTQFSDNLSSTNDHCHQRCCVPSTNICHIDCNSTNSNDYVFDMNDHSTLISNCILKKKKYKCHCSLLEEYGSKSNTYYSQPWITFIHILCTVRKYFTLIVTLVIIL